MMKELRSQSLPQLNCTFQTELKSKSLSDQLDFNESPAFWICKSADDISEKRLSTSDLELNLIEPPCRYDSYPLDCCGHPEENEILDETLEEELLPSLSVISEDDRETQQSASEGETPTGEMPTKLKRNSVPPMKFAELLGLKDDELSETDIQSLLPWDGLMDGQMRMSKSSENLRLKNSLSLPAEISANQRPKSTGQSAESGDADGEKTPSYYVNLAHGIKEDLSPRRHSISPQSGEAPEFDPIDQSAPETVVSVGLAPQLDRSKSVSTPSISLSGSDSCTCSEAEKADPGASGDTMAVLRVKPQNAVGRKKSSTKHHSALPYMMTSRPIIGAGRSLKNYKFPDSGAGDDSKEVELKAVIQRTPTADMVMTRQKRDDDETVAKKATRRSSHFFPSWSKKPKKPKPHFFIDTSCSNSLVCDLCMKPLANTQALQCNNCEITIHNSCKDQASSSCVSQKHHPKALRPSISVKSVDIQVQPKLSLDSSQSASDLKNGRPASLVSYLSDTDATEENTSTTMAPPPEVAPPNLAMQFAANLTADPAWIPLGLWREDAEAWSCTMTKPVLKEMNTKDIKRQDIIHELVVTEKHHCRILVILKQTYWQRLASINIPKLTLDQLFPSLDLLLEIHLHFFRLLRERKSEGPKVEKINDVIFEQFAGDISPKMRTAYVNFCSHKDKAVQTYNTLMRENLDFRTAIEQIMKVTSYKDKSLPDCLLLVAQRLTKYHVLIEQIRKNTRDETGELQQMESAEKAVKSFLADIDSGVDQYQMELRRQEICHKFDPKSTTKFAEKLFGVEQLRQSGRILLHNVSINWRSPTKKNDNVPVELLLFTDMVVFLQKSGTAYNFLSLDQKASVISLEKLIVREIATNTRLSLGSKSLGLFLIRTQPQPEMYEIYCQNKKDFARLYKMLLSAQEKFSKNVSNNLDANDEETEDDVEELEDSTGLTEENMEKIMEILQRNVTEDDALSVYYEKKLQCYRQLRDYVESLNAKVKVQVCRQIMEVLEENMKEINSEESKTGELSFWPNWLIFADIYGYAAGCSNKSPYPRRAETFHGVLDTSNKPIRSVKKHPTITGISDSDSILSSVRHHKSADLVTVSIPAKPSVSDASVTCRKITEKMLMRMADLEHTVKRLSSEKTMLDTELSVLKSCKGKVMKNRRSNDFYAAPLEQLRQKESEFMRAKIDFERHAKDRELDLEQKERQIAAREAQLVKAEAEIFERWKVLRSELPSLPRSPFGGDQNGHADSISSVEDDPMSPASVSLTPTQLSFASETDSVSVGGGSHSRSQSATRQKEEKTAGDVKSSSLAEVKRNGSTVALVPHLMSAVNENRLKDSAGVQPVIQQEIPKNLLSRTSPPKPTSMATSMSFLRGSASFLTRNSSVEKLKEEKNSKRIQLSNSAGKLQLNNNNLSSPAVTTTDGIQQMLPFKLAQEGNKKK